jgi:hypothetical protein
MAATPPIDWQQAVQSQTGQQPVDTSFLGSRENETPLPEILGLAGGIAGGLLMRNPAAGASTAINIGRMLIPSLAGSTVGTGVGLLGEAALTKMTPERAFNTLASNAAWDVGGNLVFMGLGKAYKIGKDALQQAGITKAGSLDDARLAAQKFLTERGATLTQGQLTGGGLEKFLENVSRGGTGAPIYARQQEEVAKAITQGTEEVKTILGTSDIFKDALRTDRPLNLAAGQNFQSLIDTARTSFKDTYRPFYESLSKDYGVYVDIRTIKQQAETELERLGRIKNAGSAAERKAVLDQIVKQDDFLEFGAAHDLRSAFQGAASDLVVPGAGTSSKGAAYTKYASGLEAQMDSAMQLVGPTAKRIEKEGLQATITPATSDVAIQTGTQALNPYTQKTELSKELLKQYTETQRAYKSGMQGMFSGTINQAMKESPSKVGEYLFDLAQTEKSDALNKALAEVSKYSKGTAAGKEVMNDFKYGFLNQALSTPEQAASFAKKLTDDPNMKAGFYKIFGNEAKQLKDILNAADIGLEKQSGNIVSGLLQNKAAITGGQVAAGALGYFVMPQEIREKLADNLPEAALTAGLYILTPRIIAKAATNKEALNALSGLASVSGKNRIGGAAATKIVDRLNTTGIMDVESVNEMKSLFQIPQPVQQQEPSAMPSGPIDWQQQVAPQ